MTGQRPIVRANLALGEGAPKSDLEERMQEWEQHELSPAGDRAGNISEESQSNDRNPSEDPAAEFQDMGTQQERPQSNTEEARNGHRPERVRDLESIGLQPLVTQATEENENDESRQTGRQKEPEGSCPDDLIKVNELALTFEQDRDENEWREVEIPSCQSIESDPRQREGLGSRAVTTLS